MKALIHEGAEGIAGLKVREAEMPALKGNEIRIRVNTAGMNRRDLAVITKRHKMTDPALIPGSDASGVVDGVGDKVTRFRPGDEVVVNPGLGWKHKSAAPPEGFEIVGLPYDGTFAEYYTTTEEHVERKPAHLTLEEAGVVPLAALTAYRACFTRGNLTKGQTILLPGIGSGVLTFALKFAKAVGARVIVTSRSIEKQQTALKLGADIAIDTNSDWQEKLSLESVDLLLESIGAATFNKSIQVVKKGGTIVAFGATTDDVVNLNIREFFYGQYNLLGSTMGSAEEFRDMLLFIEKHDIRPHLDRTFILEEYKEAFEYMQDSHHFGKIGFRIG